MVPLGRFKSSGRKVNFPMVMRDMLSLGRDQVRVTAVITLSLKEFDLTPPSLPGIPIADSVLVDLDMTWMKVKPPDVRN